MIASAARRFRVTIIHPVVGRRTDMRRYIRTWLMAPLPAAAVSALLPAEVERRFYDDRLEAIPYDEPTDLVALSVETYTAKRCYQIASEYRRRGVPVLMGGYHATLCPDEVARYADVTVVGEAEANLPEALDDLRHGRARGRYDRPRGAAPIATPDRSIFRGKGYLPIRLVEFARGCRFRCDFCAITAFHQASQRSRPVADVVDEVRRVHRRGRLLFFIDDNLTSDPDAARELFRALIERGPPGLRWVSQTAMPAAWDEELLALMRRSGCEGILVGIESLDEPTLRGMNKGFNLMRDGPAEGLRNFRRHGIRVYGTFVFGYDGDTIESTRRAVEFARAEGLFIAAFNHLTPFPGTPLYRRLLEQSRLTSDAWWLDDRYRYNMVPFRPAQMTALELEQACLEARRRFYGWSSIVARAKHRVNRADPLMLAHFLAINAMHQRDVGDRSGLPLGDEACTRPLLPR